MKNVSPLNLAESCVLVLGAGASKPFGFPTGQELKGEVLNQFNPMQHLILNELNFPDSFINEFHEDLKYSSHPTIDIFLEKMQKYREIGSHAIALTIMPKERHDNLFPKQDWYGYLFDLLNFEVEHPRASNLSIVTLNYDRSLEHFLEKSIRYECGDTKRDFAAAKQKQIKIIHAHGSFGEYPSTPYGLDINMAGQMDKRKQVASMAKQAASQIKIVSDALVDSPNFQAAQEIISKAKHVVFLGFGYHELTLNNLLAKANVNEQIYWGTIFELPDRTTQRVNAYFESKGSKIRSGSNRTNCMSYLQLLSIACDP